VASSCNGGSPAVPAAGLPRFFDFVQTGGGDFPQRRELWERDAEFVINPRVNH